MKYVPGLIFLCLLTSLAYAQPVGSTYKKKVPVLSRSLRTNNTPEICNNNIDDDGNGLTDEKDLACHFKTPHSSSIVWGCEGSGGIYWADLSTGQTQLAADLPFGFLDIAWGSDGKLYGMEGGDPSGIWEIDLATATPTYKGVPRKDVYVGNAMTADAEGNLYMNVYANNTSYIAKLNIATWELCFIVDLNPHLAYSAGDLAFYNGYLYMTCSDNKMARIDVRTGEVILQTLTNATTGYFGLVTYNGHLYVNDVGRIYQVDPATMIVNTTPSFSFNDASNVWIYGLATYSDGYEAPACAARATINYPADGSFCMTSGVELQASVCGIESPQFTWTTPQGNTTAAPAITAMESGKYYLSYKNNSITCSKVDSFMLTYPDKPVLKIDTAYRLPGPCNCNGSMTVTVDCGSGNYTYAWSTGATTASVTGVCIGEYTVTITDVVTGSDTLIRFSLPAATKGIEDAEVIIAHDHCDQQQGSIAIKNVQGGVAPYSYSIDGRALGPVASFEHLAKGNYLLTIHDNGGCHFQKKITVDNISGPEKLWFKKADALCGMPAGNLIIDSVKNGAPPYTFAVDQEPYTPAITQVRVQPGKRIILVKDNYGCTLKDSVVIDQSEKLRVMVTPHDSIICSTEKITLRATVLSNSPDVRFTWGNNTPVSSAVFQTAVYETTKLVVQATDRNGCTAADSVVIQAKYCDSLFAKCVLFANAFSPNNDGLNDLFGPVRGSCEIKDFKFTIYNRYGQIVFQTNHAGDRWNGTIHGHHQPAGVYLYNCYWKDAAGMGHPQKGQVMLLR